MACKTPQAMTWFVCIFLPPQASLSLPGSPFMRRGSSQFSWKRKGFTPGRGDKQPLVLPYLDTLNFPYADDSRAVTPSIEDLVNPYNTQYGIAPTHTRRRLSSAASLRSKTSHHHFPDGAMQRFSRRSSFTSDHSKFSDTSKTGKLLAMRKQQPGRGEPTHFYWHPKAIGNSTLPDVVVDKTRDDDNVS